MIEISAVALTCEDVISLSVVSSSVVVWYCTMVSGCLESVKLHWSKNPSLSMMDKTTV